MGRALQDKTFRITNFNRNYLKCLVIPTVKDNGYRWDVPIVWSNLHKMKFSFKYLNINSLYYMYNQVENEY